MTQDEIIEMVLKAHNPPTTTRWWDMDVIALEAFAKLVAQREREKFIDMLRMAHDSYALASDPGQLKERGTR